MTTAFGTIFNEITVPRFDANGAVTELLHVPLSYAPKERVMAKLIDDPEIAKQSAVSPLPRISFQLTSIDYDPDRMLNPTQNMAIVKSSNTVYSRQLEAVPYDFKYTLWVYVKDVEDGNKIAEQILWFFRPEFPLKAELVPQMGLSANIPITLVDNSIQDSYDGDFKGERRAVIWTFNFTAKSWIYGPIREDKIIKFANINLYAPTVLDLTTAVGNTKPIDRVTSQPGLTANGQPTSNISLTIPYQNINSDDDWAYITIRYGTLDPSDGSGGNQSNNLPYQG